MNYLHNLSLDLAAGTSLTQKFVDWAVAVMNKVGEPGVALIIALENLFPPIPSEAVLPLAGFSASKGDLNLILVILWATVGSVVGAIMLYYIGAALGRDRTREWAKKIPLMKVGDIDKTEKWFVENEGKTVFLGRMLPIFRSLISIPAGIEKMPMKKFIPYTIAGSLVWNSALAGAGYGLGERWNKVEQYAGQLQNAVIVIVLLGLIYFVVKRLKR
jgi:membrane protein DedA with SNARE-associated domain